MHIHVLCYLMNLVKVFSTKIQCPRDNVVHKTMTSGLHTISKKKMLNKLKDNGKKIDTMANVSSTFIYLMKFFMTKVQCPRDNVVHNVHATMDAYNGDNCSWYETQVRDLFYK